MWRATLLRVKQRSTEDNLSVVAAGVAFYAMLAVFPALIALVGLYGLAFDAQQVHEHLSTLTAVLPEQAADLIERQVRAITSADRTSLGLGSLAGLISYGRWPLLAALMFAGLALLYRYGPSRPAPVWRWMNWGAAVAVALWLAGSALFSLYVSAFASYNRTYGSLGAVVILLLWFLISAYAVLLGAELNAELRGRRRQRPPGSELERSAA